MKDLILSLNRLGTNGKRKTTQHKLLIALTLVFATYPTLRGAKGEEKEKIGNFSLPTSQQPGPLFGFGQNIVDKGDLQLFLNLLQIGGSHRNLTQILPSILYGIRDNLSVFVTIPFTPTSKNGCGDARGMNDITVQFEYAYFNNKKATSITQSTFIASIGIPTGSEKKIPDTGFGAPSLFLGATFSHTEQYWYGWIQGGTTLTTQRHERKSGNQFFYQTGIENCFATRPGWIFAWELELLGFFEQKDKLCGVKNENSGGNTLWMGPSLWISSEKLIFEIGITGPIAQHLYGNQFKNKYYFTANMGYKF